MSAESGANINQWEYWGGDCQLWSIQPVYPQVNSGEYTVRNVSSGLFAAESSGNAVQSKSQSLKFTRLDDGANLCQWEYWGGDGQKFVIEPAPGKTEVCGDVNVDGKFDTSDVLLLQKWLLGVPDVHLDNWKSGDLHQDNILNVVDLCLMKHELLK